MLDRGEARPVAHGQANVKRRFNACLAVPPTVETVQLMAPSRTGPFEGQRRIARGRAGG